MKIRTKLVLLLSGALIVTLVASTVLRIRWTRRALETRLQDTVRTTAEVVADDLMQRLKADPDDTTIAEELSKVKLRHPMLSSVLLKLDTDEDTTATFSLAPETDEPQVAHSPRKRGTPQQRAEARREEARRFLLDHGESARRPGAGIAEPMWWTSSTESARTFPARVAVRPAPKVATRTFREGDERPGVTATIPIDPDGPGPRRGELSISTSLEPIEALERVEFTSSLAITGGALLLLVLLSTFIVDRVVGRPVSELEAVMQRVSGGVLDVRVDVERKDEIGALGTGFNAMLARLAEADGEIRAFNARLADEVRGATEDLAKKNAQLAQLNRLLLDARRQIGDKERLAALGQLAAQLAHEIGTPLASVSGHLQLAIGNRDASAPLKERLEVARSELGRISKIVRDYLDQTRAVQPERVRVQLEKVVVEAIELVHGDEKRGQVRMEHDLGEGPELVYTDPGLLRQILVNLLTNAADAVSAGGTVRVHTQLLPSGEVELAVIDDGVGIAAEDAARIFEPFYTTKGRGKGTGLGLAICRELATAMGGRISVRSEPGHGSTFTLTLPHVIREELSA